MAPDEEIVRSRSNPLFKRLRALKERGVGPEGGLCLLEGPKLVEEALAAGLTIAEAAVTRRTDERPLATTVVAELRARRVPVRLLDDRLLAALSDAETTQGLVALAHRPAPDEARLFGGTPLILVAVASRTPATSGACCARRRPRAPPAPVSSRAAPIHSRGRRFGAPWARPSVSP